MRLSHGGSGLKINRKLGRAKIDMLVSIKIKTPKTPNISPVEGMFKKTGEEKGRDSERNFTEIKSVILAEILCKQYIAHCQIIIYYT